MIHLILVRHGNTFEASEVPVQIGAGTDLHLTAQGRKQAEMMGDYLRVNGIIPAGIYAGNLRRQTEFAELLGPYTLEPALTEIDYGKWEGLTPEQIERRWSSEYAAWNESAKWPRDIFKGTYEEHWKAIVGWLAQLRKNHAPGETVIGVSSNGLMRFFCKEKVRTGHFCQMDLLSDRVKIKSWNTNPQDATLRI